MYQGVDRTAFVGERYTVKIARTNIGQFLKSTYRIRETAGFTDVVKMWKAYSADQHQSLKNLLLHGIVANQREYRLAKQDTAVVVPTISILKGLVNVQLTASPTNLGSAHVHAAFTEQLGPEITTLGHMLEDTGNLGIVAGAVVFVDGGSQGLERLMETRPDSVARALGSLTMQLDADS